MQIDDSWDLYSRLHAAISKYKGDDQPFEILDWSVWSPTDKESIVKTTAGTFIVREGDTLEVIDTL